MFLVRFDVSVTSDKAKQIGKQTNREREIEPNKPKHCKGGKG